ncbi:lipopolysaccharide biosynthesis protein [Porphyromonas gingivalis]|uniref:lipopolysaccharide biosynthesis protein n=1 Tax=Porphyromonas gingivalis TaxID=837 RepID=UPI000B6D32C9|nr:oligosaccharide flippase family protein [Porphyromonas gingivalis]OWR77843.1 polysaccharide biosynthesis protein [Porphyromonas gingivalis SJD4]
MASGIRGLMKDTAVYGLSTILVRLLNWLMTIVYVRALPGTADFGNMTNLYAWTALAMIVLTYGMETGFFRFINKAERPNEVYSTTLWSLGATSTFFLCAGLLFLRPLSGSMGYADHPEYVGLLLAIVAMDAFMAIPLAYLRYANRPWRFMFVRLTFILLTIVLTIFFLFLCPRIYALHPEWIDSFYRPNYELGYVFVINFICNLVQMAMLFPHWRHAGHVFRPDVLRKMLVYSFPILLLGLAGSFNNQADKILFPMLFDDPAEGKAQLGIYGACYKLAIIMVMFTQAFRYAYDPFVFAKIKSGEEEGKESYATAMKYFVIFVCFIYLGVMAYMDILKHFVSPAYYGGLKVVPFVMLGQLMFGIYFNLSLWYKVTDRTIWGAVFSLIGCVTTVLIIVFGARTYGFMACAWASVISNGLIMLLSYFTGRHYFPVPYRLGNALFYAALTALLVGGTYCVAYLFPQYTALRLGVNTLFVLLFVIIAFRKDLSGIAVPILNRIRKR